MSMSEHSNNVYELIEKYCLDLMDEKERLYFELEMEKNPALKEAVEEHKTILLSFDHLQSVQFIHESLDAIHNHSRSSTQILINNLKLNVNKYWKTASVAASVAFVASIMTFLGARTIYKKDTQRTYIELKGDINNLKTDQRRMKSDLSKVRNDIKKNDIQLPEGDSKFSGTAFALNQSGYMVTNLHVVKDYNKIYVFTADNQAHPCSVVKADEENDLAVLRITEEGFTFGSKIPYSVQKANPNIAQRIYSLGFPKADIVYNEGYISSTTGFEGDTSHYQLELPSSPGVSGAPIIDETGNVIGIVSGKQSQSEGITFAVKSKALLALVKSLPEDFNQTELVSNNIRSMTRANQVKKIQPFVCVVRVYN